MAQINDAQIEVWVAEGENGSVLFDSCPSQSDVLNACEDLERPLRIYAVTCIPIEVELMMTLDDRPENEREESPTIGPLEELEDPSKL